MLLRTSSSATSLVKRLLVVRHPSALPVPPRRLVTTVRAMASSSSSLSVADLKMFTYPVETPVQRLECKTAFDKLTEDEKKYAWALSVASWKGSLAVLVQTSPEAPLLFVFLLQFFKGQSLDEVTTSSPNAFASDGPAHFSSARPPRRSSSAIPTSTSGSCTPPPSLPTWATTR